MNAINRRGLLLAAAAAAPLAVVLKDARLAKAAGRAVEAYWYEADHAFANPTGARYDEADAALAWERTQAYLKKRIG